MKTKTGVKVLPAVSTADKITKKPVHQTVAGKAISAFIVLQLLPGSNAKHIATIHVFYSGERYTKGMWVDVFVNEILIHQYRGSGEDEPFYQYYGKREDYPFGVALDGVELAEIRLFAPGVKINQDIPAIASREDKTYLAGLDRLKALGYQVIKVI
jgi:hypothetical protein